MIEIIECYHCKKRKEEYRGWGVCENCFKYWVEKCNTLNPELKLEVEKGNKDFWGSLNETQKS